MESIRETQKKYGSRAFTLAIIVSLILILAGYKPIGKGLILGTFFSIINFVLMGESLPMRLAKSKGKTFAFSLGSIFFRHIILAIPVVVAIKFEEYNFFSVFAGLFLVQLVILADHVAGLIFSAKNKGIGKI